MDKQYTKSIKDFLVDIVSNETGVDPDACHTVVMWAYNEARKQILETCSVELSGFGSLLVSQTKLKRKMKGMDDIIEKGTKRNSGNELERLTAIWAERDSYLKSKIRE